MAKGLKDKKNMEAKKKCNAPALRHGKKETKIDASCSCKPKNIVSTSVITDAEPSTDINKSIENGRTQSEVIDLYKNWKQAPIPTSSKSLPHSKYTQTEPEKVVEIYKALNGYMARSSVSRVTSVHSYMNDPICDYNSKKPLNENILYSSSHEMPFSNKTSKAPSKAYKGITGDIDGDIGKHKKTKGTQTEAKSLLQILAERDELLKLSASVEELNESSETESKENPLENENSVKEKYGNFKVTIHMPKQYYLASIHKRIQKLEEAMSEVSRTVRTVRAAEKTDHSADNIKSIKPDRLEPLMHKSCCESKKQRNYKNITHMPPINTHCTANNKDENFVQYAMKNLIKSEPKPEKSDILVEESKQLLIGVELRKFLENDHFQISSFFGKKHDESHKTMRSAIRDMEIEEKKKLEEKYQRRMFHLNMSYFKSDTTLNLVNKPQANCFLKKRGPEKVHRKL